MGSMPSISESDLEDPTEANELLDTLFQQVIQYTEESQSWPILYTHGNITTRHIRKKGYGPNKFLQRSSIHHADQVTYDQLRTLLFIDHTLNEPKYQVDLTDTICLKKINDEADIYWMGYKSPPLAANREFVELVATREIGRSFIVATLPVDTKKEVKKGFVRGAYRAWELVSEKENEKGEKFVEWICIQHSSAGGIVPSFISDYIAGNDFHHGVNQIIKCIQEEEKSNL